MTDLLAIVASLSAITLMFCVYTVIPASMALSRNRSPVIWVVAGFIATPLVAILLLWALGDAE